MGKLMRNGEEIGQLNANITYSAEGDILGDAAASDVVAGKTFSSSNGVALTGTLPNLSTDTTIDFSSSNATPVIEADAAYISTNSDNVSRLCLRYANKAGYLVGNTLFGYPASNFGDATDAYVLSGKTFTSSGGIKVAGTMTNNGAVSKAITPSTSIQTYTIPKGYHSGSGKVTVSAISGYFSTSYASLGSNTADSSNKDLTLTVDASSIAIVLGICYGASLHAFTTSSGTITEVISTAVNDVDIAVAILKNATSGATIAIASNGSASKEIYAYRIS